MDRGSEINCTLILEIGFILSPSIQCDMFLFFSISFSFVVRKMERSWRIFMSAFSDFGTVTGIMRLDVG